MHLYFCSNAGILPHHPFLPNFCCINQRLVWNEHKNIVRSNISIGNGGIAIVIIGHGIKQPVTKMKSFVPKIVGALTLYNPPMLSYCCIALQNSFYRHTLRYISHGIMVYIRSSGNCHPVLPSIFSQTRSGLHKDTPGFGLINATSF